jgi:hypothetical protein
LCALFCPTSSRSRIGNYEADMLNIQDLERAPVRELAP